MGYEVIGKNLRRLRNASGLTQGQLAEAAGLSRVGYRNIETGKSVPKVETVRALAVALEVPVEQVVSRVHEIRQVRFRSLKRLRSREQILAEVGRKLADVQELEEALGDTRPFELAGLSERLPGAGEERAIAAAPVVREAFGRRDDEPIRDICGLLESNGVKVFSTRLASNDFFGLSVGPNDGGPAIVVNTWDRISVERWIFSAAHELGHLILHLDAFDVMVAAEDSEQEKEANAFASHFLMPEGVFQKEWDETYGLPFVSRVLKVKRMFRVSYKTVLYRLAGTHPDVNVWRLFQNGYRLRFGRTLGRADEPDGLREADYHSGAPEANRAGEPTRLVAEDFLHDRLWYLVRTGVEGGVISLARGAEILDVPLDEIRAASRGWVGSL
jgi:Zn-dependent peptidase ImmA (M78 family)/DNA-binding XRE family transcriptional regulator